MLSSYDADYEVPRLVGRSTGRGLYLFVEDVDDVYNKALAGGATSVFPPEGTGTRRARVLDLEGGECSFGSYEPGAEW